MKKTNSGLLAGALFVSFSLFVYALQILAFGSVRNTAFYLLQDLAFLPLELAIVWVLLGRILNAREKRDRLKKLDMAISAFFGEVGSSLVVMFRNCGTLPAQLTQSLRDLAAWDGRQFAGAMKAARTSDIAIGHSAGLFAGMKSTLHANRSALLRMLGNPNLIEHDTFTDMLWALFHLTDELSARDDFDALPESDLLHLSIDAKRAASELFAQWIGYMWHLKSDYPYLFSLEARRNPFDSGVSVIVG
jgi:hypothetical protein